MIVRVAKKKRLRFTIMSNVAIEDGRLSWDALGLLTYLLSKPDSWEVSIRHLVSEKTAGVDKVRKMLRELVDAGYCKRKLVHERAGNFAWKSTIYEEPNQPPSVENPPMVNPSMARPSVENSTLSNTDRPKTEKLLKTDLSKRPDSDLTITGKNEIRERQRVQNHPSRELERSEGELRQEPFPPWFDKLVTETIAKLDSKFGKRRT
jgi:hypothetical protein